MIGLWLLFAPYSHKEANNPLEVVPDTNTGHQIMKKSILLGFLMTVCLTVSAQQVQTCGYCQGYGAVACPTCKGAGQVSVYNPYYGRYVYMACSMCGGYRALLCPRCGGTKRVVVYNPSFGQSEASTYNGKKCGIRLSNGHYCNCSGCQSGNWDPFTCSKCSHKCNKHTR